MAAGLDMVKLGSSRVKRSGMNFGNFEPTWKMREGCLVTRQPSLLEDYFDQFGKILPELD